MPVGTKNFPTSLDTVLELVEVTNDASTQLNGALTIGATTVTVDSTSLFPSSGIITIDSENISYTGKTATTFTGCTRGAESTTAATHDDNATVELLITAALPNVHAQAIIAIETKLGIDSSTPTANKVLRATGTGTSAWGAVVNADIDASAAIAVSKLAALTASRLPVLDASGFLSASSVTATEAGYLSGVTSAIQTQLDGKQTAFGSQTANFVYAGPASGGAASPSFRALVAADIPSHNQAWSTITSTPTTLSGYGITDAQPLDSDLTVIAGLSPSNDDIIQRKAGAWTNRTPTQLTADLNAVVGDSGSGGTKGLVPAPAAGDAAAGKFLKADGTWATAGGDTPGGSGSEIQYRSGASTFGAVTGSSVSGANVAFAPDATTGNGLAVAGSAITSGNLVSIAASGTAAASNTKNALNVATSGANATSTQTTYGARFSNTSTGTSSTNIGANFSASGGTNNYAINVSAGTILSALGTLTTASQPALSITQTWNDAAVAFNAVSIDVTPTASASNATVFRVGTATTTGYSPALATFKAASGKRSYLQIDAPSGQASQLDFNENGTRKFYIYTGAGSSVSALAESVGLDIGTGAATTARILYNNTAILTFAAAATLQAGAADAASPTAQTWKHQSVSTGTTNTSGATWTLRGSLGTSQGVPGRTHIQGGALIAASGSTQQTAVDRHISGATKVLTNNSAIAIVNATAATETNAAGVIDYAVEVLDGTDVQYEVGSVAYGVSNKGGVFSGNTATKFGNHQNATSGTLTVTFAISGANPAVLSVNANSSLSPSTGYPRITYTLRNLTQQAVSIQ